MRPINPYNNAGSIQLKFSFQGTRYSFHPIPRGTYDNPRDLATARAIGTQIQNDILAGCFDPTLARYRLSPRPPKRAPEVSLLALWDSWVSSLALAPATQAADYDLVRAMIVKAAPRPHETAWFTQAPLAPSTYNKRLGYLKSCMAWATAQGLMPSNPYSPLRSRRGGSKPVKPFTSDEVQVILDAFGWLAPHYAPFVRFLFMTGVRTSEAIGLRWGHIDLSRNELTISESLPRDRTGNGYTKVRKGTKTGSIRTLGLPQALRDLLLDLKPPKPDPDSLVFLSPQGCPIDPGNFLRRFWCPVLRIANVPYRCPYTIRHTVLSHAIEQGTPITGVAYLAGHRDATMVLRHYGKMVNRPSLPSGLS
jgi:integrase